MQKQTTEYASHINDLTVAHTLIANDLIHIFMTIEIKCAGTSIETKRKGLRISKVQRCSDHFFSHLKKNNIELIANES